MVEIPKQSGEESSILSNSGSAEASVKKITSDRLMEYRSGIGKFESVILNMDDLCSQLNDNGASPSISPHNQAQRNLSHKGSFRGEKKGYHEPCKASSHPPPVPPLDEIKCQSSVAPICTVEGSLTMGECRSKRSRRPWLDPRRVMMIFATLSSIGTMVLIYYTMAIGKINGDHAQA